MNRSVAKASLHAGANSSLVYSSFECKRIFLTGGTGLFGKWILTALKGVDVELVLLTRNPEVFKRSFPIVESMRVRFIKGDVRNFKFPSGDFDFLIHAATPVVSDDLSDASDEMRSIIIEGTKHVLEFARASSVRRMLYVSSGAVYGLQPPELECIPETFPCNPVTVYGKGKWIAEQLCLDSELNCVIARCFTFVGPYMPLNAHFAIGNFIRNCLRNEPIVIKGDGTELRSYMYASDLAEWLLVLMLRGSANEVYNVGSDFAISIWDLAQKVRSIASKNNPIEIRKKPLLNTHGPERYIPSIQKAGKCLSLGLKIELDHAIRKAFNRNH